MEKPGGFPGQPSNPRNQELSEERRHRDSAEASKRQAMSEVAQWQERYSTLQQQLGSDGWPVDGFSKSGEHQLRW